MMRSKRILALLLSMVLLGTALSGCGGGSTGTDSGEGNSVTEGGSTGEPVQGGEITVGIAQDLDNSLDPHLAVAAGTKEVMFNVFEGLVKPNADGELIPAVAERYEVSEDKTQYTFTLRDGITFHNGDAVTVEDIVYSINRCADDSEGTPLVPALSAVQTVEATDEKTVVVTIDAPNNEFLSYMTLAILPEDYTEQDTAPVGTGPFKFVSRSPQQNIVLERYDGYWGTPAYLDKVTFQIVENPDALVMSLQSGALDLVAHLTYNQTVQLGDDFNIVDGPMNLVQAIYLNNKVAPFDNETVRQALCYAIDIQQIMDLTAGGSGYPVGSSMYPAFQKYFDDSLTNYYSYDPAKAKELLAQAGYADGFDMTITVPSNYQPHLDAAQVVEQQLEAVGINVTIQPVTWTSWLNDTYIGRDFQATLVGVDASYLTARAMLERFTSTADDNFINYNNPEYDQLFQQAITSTDDETQTQLYKQMERVLTETAANVYLQDLANFVAMNKDLGGLEFYPVYVLDLSTVYYTA